MEKNKTISINGRDYDVRTGLPINDSASSSIPPHAAPRATHHATEVHKTPERSKTLLRRSAKKPAKPAIVAPRKPSTGRTMDIARSSSISKFAPHPVIETPVHAKRTDVHVLAKPHPTVQRALQQQSKRSTQPTPASSHQTAKQIKDTAIAKALATEVPKKKANKKPFKTKLSRFSLIGGLLLAVLGIGGYFTYVNMPSLSVRVASAQAGIEASFPNYHPDGYSMNAPVSYSDGEVVLSFKSNSSDTGFTITQSRSSWDSSAVLENLVKKAVDANYITTQEQGLTIFSYGGNAAWVNGGILYVIDSTAPLSGEQIRQIATSL
ncbi:MAG: hypothetical protein JWN33_558 [Candidatus Saccharibacteria bacterium]|nr:hypothetical protein [Candidatus Saccharibacteria bacterium]